MNQWISLSLKITQTIWDSGDTMKINDSYTVLSRYSQPRVVTMVASNKYIIDGPSEYYRGGVDDDGNNFVDYDGGPFVFVSDSMLSYGGSEKERIAEITVIESTQNGYLTLEVLTTAKVNR